MSTDELDPLRRFAASGDQEAFVELVRLHLPLVYSTAVRRLNGDTHLAEDVAQRVFLALAKKSKRLVHQRTLVGWLHRSTQLEAAQAVRGEQRRRDRERIAHTMNENTEPTPHWETLAPLLDEALDKLPERDREAVLLRFFAAKSFSEVGAALNVSADAARVRVDRALDRLHTLLVKRGLTSTASALDLVLSQSGGLAAPPGLAAHIIQNTFALSAVGTASVGSFFLMTASKLQLSALGLLLAATVTTIVVQHRSNTRMRAQVLDLRAELSAKNSDTTHPSSSGDLASENEHAELIRARARLAELEREKTTYIVNELGKNTSEPSSENSTVAPKLTPVESLGNAGFATPRDAFATQLWAARGGDVALEARALLLGPKARAELEKGVSKIPAEIQNKYSSPEELMAFALAGSPVPIAGMQVLSETPQDPDNVTLRAAWQHEGSPEVITNDVRFHRTPDGWKLVVPPQLVDRLVNYLSPPPARSAVGGKRVLFPRNNE